MCIEVYPIRAPIMSVDFDELVGPDREGLIYEKEDPLVLVPEGAVSASHPMVEGTEDGDYYRGRVVGPTQTQTNWVRSRRPEDLNLEPVRTKAALTASGRGNRHTVEGALRRTPC